MRHLIKRNIELQSTIPSKTLYIIFVYLIYMVHSQPNVQIVKSPLFYQNLHDEMCQTLQHYYIVRINCPVNQLVNPNNYWGSTIVKQLTIICNCTFSSAKVHIIVSCSLFLLHPFKFTLMKYKFTYLTLHTTVHK